MKSASERFTRTVVPSRRAMAGLAPCALAIMIAIPLEQARACSAGEIAAVIDATGQRLRQINADTQPRLQTRMRQLGERERWAAADVEEKAYAYIADDEMRALDDQASGLLVRLDRLGSEQPTCERLAELKTVAGQLVEVTTARSTHISARLDGALRPASATVAAPKAEPAPKPQRAPPAVAAPAPAKPAPAAPAWQTETKQPPAGAVVPGPAVVGELPPRVGDLADAEFSEDDIRAAGSGFFGSISANLASVMEYAFKSYGRPTGYVLGTEGGGALIAGLRYGDGTLVTKRFGERKVFWQGPSLGYDFGLAGSRVMFLVYNLRDGEELFTRFAGVDGSAYIIGGVGITFLKKGRLVLAPIRSGVGLRLGASVGYLKFTPTPSLNPF